MKNSTLDQILSSIGFFAKIARTEGQLTIDFGHMRSKMPKFYKKQHLADVRIVPSNFNYIKAAQYPYYTPKSDEYMEQFLNSDLDMYCQEVCMNELFNNNRPYDVVMRYSHSDTGRKRVVLASYLTKEQAEQFVASIEVEKFTANRKVLKAIADKFVPDWLNHFDTVDEYISSLRLNNSDIESQLRAQLRAMAEFGIYWA